MKSWIGKSFRNRIFVTMLLAAMLPLLLCGVLMMRLQVVRGERSLAVQAEDQLGALSGTLETLEASCRETLGELSGSTVVHSALRRGGGDSRTLYQVLYRASASVSDSVRLDVYDKEGVCRYTTSGVPSGSLITDWGILRAAGDADGMVMRSGEDGGLNAAQAVRSGGEILGYVTAEVTQSGFDHLFPASIPPPAKSFCWTAFGGPFTTPVPPSPGRLRTRSALSFCPGRLRAGEITAFSSKDILALDLCWSFSSPARLRRRSWARFISPAR